MERVPSTMKLRDFVAGLCFGAAYAVFDAVDTTHGLRVITFHFVEAVLAGWTFFHTSRLLQRNVTLDPVPFSHRLVRWPAVIVLICGVVALILGNVHPVLLPLALALAVLSGSLGGMLSVWLRRNA